MKLSVLVLVILLACAVQCGKCKKRCGKRARYPTKDELIKTLNMTMHVEGGYFLETYRASETTDTPDRVDGKRSVMTSIFYMLTNDRPIGRFHRNKSNIVHYFQAGSSLKYYIIYPDGKLEEVVLGLNILKGEVPQMIVKGGCWKATELEKGEYGLLGEAVAPGFDYRDMEIGKAEDLKRDFPHLTDLIEKFAKHDE